MQKRLLFLSLNVAFGVRTAAELKANTWLQAHAAPNGDELAELRNENPDAYALVKALLTKRSLGLLDPKHPTASFSAPAHDDSQDHAVGAAVYAKFATTAKEQEALSGSDVAQPYPDASSGTDVAFTPAAPASHDWLNWKPHNSATDDEAMVKSVLGAVADLKGKSLRGGASTESSSFQAEVAQESVAQAPVIEAAPVPAVSTTVVMTVTDAVVAVSENSYLKGLDLTDGPATTTRHVDVPLPANDEKSALDSFSFDDSTPAPTTTTSNSKAQKAANPLASWLGFAKPHIQAASAKVSATPSNPYLVDLQ